MAIRIVQETAGIAHGDQPATALPDPPHLKRTQRTKSPARSLVNTFLLWTSLLALRPDLPTGAFKTQERP